MHNIAPLIKCWYQVIVLNIQGPSFFQAWLDDLLRFQLIGIMDHDHPVFRNRCKIVQGPKVNYIGNILLMFLYFFDDGSAVNVPNNDTEIITSRNQSLAFGLWEGYAVHTGSMSIQSKQRVLLSDSPKLYCVVQAAWSKASLHKGIVFEIHNKMSMFLKGLCLLIDIVLLFPKVYVLIITACQYFLCDRIIYGFS